MSRFRVRGRRAPEPARDEDPVVRQYRFLLRKAPPDAVEAAHRQALRRLGLEERREVLAAVQGGLVAGQRLTPEDTDPLAHLIVLGERRSPNAFLGACRPAALSALARAVIHSEECFGLFGPYAAWDGLDPEPEEEGEWADAGFNPDSGRWNTSRQVPVSHDGVVGYAGGGSDGGGGGS